MTLEQRLERLERESRWIRRIGMVAAAVAAAVFLIGQGGGERTELPDLVAGSVTIKDENGNVRARLATDRGYAYLAILDKKGKDGTTVSLGGLTFTRAFQLGRSSFGWQGLTLYDKDLKLRLSLKTWRDGSPSLRFYDTNGKVIWKAPKD